ncbi:MAG TPA: hypothetical protein VII92_09100, partial [Anaerolineae bacterium]
MRADTAAVQANEQSMQRLTTQNGRLGTRSCAGIVLALVLNQGAAAQTGDWQIPASNDSPAIAAADQDPGFRAYPLHQLDAQIAQRQLTQLLGTVPGVEIVADSERNRLLIR